MYLCTGVVRLNRFQIKIAFISQDDVKAKKTFKSIFLTCFWDTRHYFTKCEIFALYSFIVVQDDLKTFYF